jgi:hypothetical protein
MESENGENIIETAAIKILKHDIKNQLSNIQLAVAGLKYETAYMEADSKLYIDSIADAAVKIDQLLNSIK